MSLVLGKKTVQLNIKSLNNNKFLVILNESQ